MPFPPTPIEIRFLKKIRKTETCWIYTGCTSNGYGKIYEGRTNGRQIRAHRFSYELHVGKIPKGMDVCHTCDVRNCVNPAHLFIGTRSDNMRDCANKGRLKVPTAGFGEDNPLSKLSWEKVKRIREECNGKRGQKIYFARLYNVNRQTIYRVINNKHWIKEPKG